jgi:FdhD protein
LINPKDTTFGIFFILENKKTYLIKRATTEGVNSVVDNIAVEEPLEIILAFGKKTVRERKIIAITMRTPGDDFQLALGFLFTEGVIFSRHDVVNMRFIDDNRLLVDLHENLDFDLGRLNRHFYTTSSCGVCGKASLDAVSNTTCIILKKDFPIVSKDILLKISTQIMDNQLLFAETGGTHASILFSTEGVALVAKEDVGRHNALDKLIGQCLHNGELPLSDKILLVSGRASFELIQKAAMAGIPIVAAVGAPSSLAIDLAHESNMTLIGFLKVNRFNIYTGSERLLTNVNFL